MSLSAHEKTQFERLTAGLELGDRTVLKKMARKDKATVMSYMPLPSRNTVLLVLAIINAFAFCGGVLTRNPLLTNIAGVFGVLLTASIVLNSANGSTAANHKPKTMK